MPAVGKAYAELLWVALDSATGIASPPGPLSASGEGVTCYPNPVHYELVIDAGFPIESLVVMDLLGREIYSGKEREVDVRDWKNGVYFVRVNGIYCVRFVKI